MKKYLFILFILLSATSFSQINVVPMPAEVTMGKGFFNISPKNTSIIYTENSTKPICIQLNNTFKKLYGFTLPIAKVEIDKISSTNKRNITLILFPKLVKSDSIAGTYNLKVNSKSITIFSMENEGIFYGIQTVLQLIENNNKQTNTKQQTTNKQKTPNKQLTTNNLTIPQLTINDYPRFPYRGMHLDVCRHFFPVDYVKKYIDYLAAYKYNTFHWHLTEDQGWRIEKKKIS